MFFPYLKHLIDPLYKIGIDETETEIAEGVIGKELKRQVIRAEEEIEAGTNSQIETVEMVEVGQEAVSTQKNNSRRI